jgi:hypothetical protein
MARRIFWVTVSWAICTWAAEFLAKLLFPFFVDLVRVLDLGCDLDCRGDLVGLLKQDIVEGRLFPGLRDELVLDRRGTLNTGMPSSMPF